MTNSTLLETLKTSITKATDQLGLMSKLLQKSLSIGGSPFDIEQKLPGTETSTADLLANMILCLNASNEVANGSAGHLIPKTSITNLTPWIDEIGNASSKLAEAFETQLGVGQILRFDYSTFTGTLDNGNQFDASSFFTTLEAALQIVLERLLPLQVFRQTKGTRIGSARPTRDLLRSLVKSLTTDSNKLARNSTESDSIVEGLRGLAKNASETLAELERNKDEAVSDRKSLTEYLAEATGKITEIRTVNDKANELEATGMSRSMLK